MTRFFCAITNSHMVFVVGVCQSMGSPQTPETELEQGDRCHNMTRLPPFSYSQTCKCKGGGLELRLSKIWTSYLAFLRQPGSLNVKDHHSHSFSLQENSHIAYPSRYRLSPVSN